MDEQDAIHNLMTRIERLERETADAREQLLRLAAGRDTGRAEGSRPAKVSRRALLLKGALAGAGAAAASSVLRPSPAEAAFGLQGDTDNPSHSLTSITAQPSYPTSSAVFLADASPANNATQAIDGLQGKGAGAANGVRAFGGQLGGPGVYSQGGGTGGSGVVALAAGATAAGLTGAGVQAVGGDASVLNTQGGPGTSSTGGNGNGTGSGGPGVTAVGGQAVTEFAPAGAGVEARGGDGTVGGYSQGGVGVIGTGGSSATVGGDGVQGFGGKNRSGVTGTGGAGGIGVIGTGGSGVGHGVRGVGTGLSAGVLANGGGSSGPGVYAIAGGPDGAGVKAAGAGAGEGLNAIGGSASGPGVISVGGGGSPSARSGPGVQATGGFAGGTVTGGHGVVAQGGSGSGGNDGGKGLLATGGAGAAPIGITPSASAGPPPANATFAVGDIWVDSKGVMWVCIVTGVPGTWTPLQPGQGTTAGSNVFYRTAITTQPTLNSSDGVTWTDIDSANLKLTITPAFKCLAVLTGNCDLWTFVAGYNQDLGISVGGGIYPSTPAQPEAWKESGGFAGTFSPNAAFVQTAIPLLAGTTYTVKLQWKTNKNAPGVTISAGAGPIGGKYSPTSLTASLVPTM